jgi:hypothetical protein
MKILLTAGYHKIQTVTPYGENPKLRGETLEHLPPTREKEMEKTLRLRITYITYFRPFRLQISARDTIYFILFTFLARDHCFLSFSLLHAGSGSKDR